MRLGICRADEGQIVEVWHGWHDGDLYRRIVDKSDWSESWYIADAAEAARVPETWNPLNGRPPVLRWRRCESPIGGAS